MMHKYGRNLKFHKSCFLEVSGAASTQEFFKYNRLRLSIGIDYIEQTV